MKRSLAGASWLFLGLSILFLIGLTAFESVLTGTALGVERLIAFLLLVLPAVIGAVFGILSLIRREGRIALAVMGVVLNSLFALFHLAVILFSG